MPNKAIPISNNLPFKVVIDQDLGDALLALSNFVETSELDSLNERVAAFDRKLNGLKDRRLGAVYGSISKLWVAYGEAKAQIREIRDRQERMGAVLDKTEGMVRLLWAWMIHMCGNKNPRYGPETRPIDPRFVLPPKY